MGKQGRPLWFTLFCCLLVTSEALLVPSSLRFRRYTVRTASPTDDVVSPEPSVLDRPVIIPTTVENDNELIMYRPEAARIPPKDPNNAVGGSGIVIIAGFENFNIQLYRKAAALVTANVPSVPVSVFTDADIAERPGWLVTINTPYQPTLHHSQPTLHINPSCQYILSIHPINHSINPSHQHPHPIPQPLSPSPPLPLPTTGTR